MTKALEQKIAELDNAISRLAGRIDALQAMLGIAAFKKDGERYANDSNVEAFRSLTTKQHATLQMLLRGATNSEIASRFGVTESTAKTYVRGIMKRLGVKNRTNVVIRLKEVFDQTSDKEYKLASGGLPKDWDERWKPRDPYKKLYYHQD